MSAFALICFRRSDPKVRSPGQHCFDNVFANVNASMIWKLSIMKYSPISFFYLLSGFKITVKFCNLVCSSIGLSSACWIAFFDLYGGCAALWAMLFIERISSRPDDNAGKLQARYQHCFFLCRPECHMMKKQIDIYLYWFFYPSTPMALSWWLWRTGHKLNNVHFTTMYFIG